MRLFVPAGREHAMTTDRQPDHLGREPKNGERRRSLNGQPRTTIALDPAALTDSGDPSMQQNRHTSFG